MQKVAFVTGSTSGIGLATGKKLLKKGYKVVFCSEKDAFDLNTLVDLDIQQSDLVNADYLKCDISVKQDVLNAVSYLKEKYSKLDYLVANAGVILRPCGIDEVTDEVIHRSLDINVIGTFYTVKYFGGLVRDTATDGAIVMLTSVDGLIGEPYAVMYSATKAAIISMMKSFSRYYKEPLVRVNAVAPGLIDTPLTSSTGEDPAATTELSVIPRMGRADEIADSIVYLLSDQASFITGHVLTVDGGFTLK